MIFKKITRVREGLRPEYPALLPRRPPHTGRPPVPVSTYVTNGYLSGSALLACLHFAMVSTLHRILAPGLSHRFFQIKPTHNQEDL